MANTCWTLTHDGEDLTHDLVVHYATEAQATEHATVYGLPHKPRQLEGPCLSVDCSCCAYVFDEDEEGFVHFESTTEIEQLLPEHGWKCDGDIWVCPTCVAGPCDREADIHG
ncbi:hypothetical protein [Acrocarpospora sp. B8E8]|uniref:hypothetical protein n=1 Tax=Acrocarpospora sp. B8E8 TaxID=3153572 RepID=UPI00325ECCF5